MNLAAAQWRSVDDFLGELLVGRDPELAAALAASDAAGLLPHHVSALQGKLLHVLALAVGARRVLEIGTLAGYSTIWLARALPRDGELVTLEADPAHASVARANIERTGLGAIVDVMVGPALETLPLLEGPFDLVFIDADKPSSAAYFDCALELSRPGTLIVVDNVVRDGAVADAANDDPSVQGVRRLLEQMAASPRVTATALQTVGAKGYDGFAIGVVSG